MKPKSIGLSRRYQEALRKHLEQQPGSSLHPAHRLGHQAVAAKLDTLDLAKIHEQALLTLDPSSSRDGLLKRAEFFFAEAITSIEETHRAALEANVHLNQVNETLAKRTIDLADSNRRLKEGIVRRKAVEKALKESGEHYTKLLGESRHLQNHLRNLTHQILSAQENERKKISRELHDEIAQTLLGINVRLLTLKKAATFKTKGLKKEIAITERVVEQSVKTLNRFALEIGIHHET